MSAKIDRDAFCVCGCFCVLDLNGLYCQLPVDEITIITHPMSKMLAKCRKLMPIDNVN